MKSLMFSQDIFSRLPATIFMAYMAIFFSTAVSADDNEVVNVNVNNFVRAETAAQFDRLLKMTGGVNKWLHLRQPTPLDQQNEIGRAHV